jgi:hypothetical protein
VFITPNEIAILGAIYFFIGILLGTIGPVGKDISKEVERARGTPLTNAVMKRDAPSETKLFLFKVIVTIGFVLLWPIFIYGITKERRRGIALEKRLEEKSKGLWFSYMGGHGKITCKDCDHSEEVTSFIHGINSSSSGFQCQGCGKLSSIKSGGPGKANQYEESLQCSCGSDLDREKVIFCPSCKSHNLSYQTLYIT